MSREAFLATFKNLDDYYAQDDFFKNACEHEMKEKNYKTYKEVCEKEYPNGLSNLNIKLINHLSLSNNTELNPFLVFYDLEDNEIKEFFYILAKTHKALRYYECYSSDMRHLKKRNTHKNITNKINDVIEYINDTDMEVKNYNAKIKTVMPKGIEVKKYLESMIILLENNHYTEQQLFQNFLYQIHILLKKNTTMPRKKIFNTVNLIIEKYFSKDITFKERTKIESYVSHHYGYESLAGIYLIHQPTNRK